MQDRIPLRGQSGNPTDHYSPSLAIVVVSPPEYKRGCCYDSNGGEWAGPRYQATGRPTLGSDSKYDWSRRCGGQGGRDARSADRQPDPRLAGGLRGPQQIKHRVGGRAAGTIAGYWILTRSTFDGADDARMEAAVGFPLCDGNTALHEILAPPPLGQLRGRQHRLRRVPDQRHAPDRLEPGESDAGDPRHLARGQPAGKRVTAARRGAAVAGNVLDCTSHPVAREALVLERRVGRAWTSARTGKTGANGSYSLVARGAGTYRVIAGTRKSNSVTVR